MSNNNKLAAEGAEVFINIKSSSRTSISERLTGTLFGLFFHISAS
jgi:hypothetical protein